MPWFQIAAVKTLKCMLMWGSLKVMGLADGFNLEYERREIHDQGFDKNNQRNRVDLYENGKCMEEQVWNMWYV